MQNGRRPRPCRGRRAATGACNGKTPGACTARRVAGGARAADARGAAGRPAERGFLDQRSGGARVSVLVAAFILSGMRALAGCHARHGGVGCADGARAAGIFFLRRRPAAYAALFLAGQGSTAGTIGLSVFPARCEAIFQCVRAERKKR